MTYTKKELEHLKRYAKDTNCRSTPCDECPFYRPNNIKQGVKDSSCYLNDYYVKNKLETNETFSTKILSTTGYTARVIYNQYKKDLLKKLIE